MKTALKLQQFKKSIISFMVGISCSFLACMIYIVDPVNMILEYNLQMKPDSLMFTLWKKPPIGIYLNVYIFNITNSEKFLSGKEKLKVQEIGPYVYKEYLENNNVTFNDNGTMSFIPKRTVVFVPEMSIGEPMKDIIKVPNVPLLGASSALQDAGFLVNYPLTHLVNMLDSKPILEMSVYDYLWGYEDTLVALASKIVPNFINFGKFGLMDRMYDEGENIVTLQIRENSDMKNETGRYLSIDNFNGSPGLAQWGYINTADNKTREENTACNSIKGATEGIIYPTHLDKDAIFRVYRKAFCRPLPIKFRKEVWTEYGLPGYYYTLTDNFADPPESNPDNECYCHDKKKCLKKGLVDLTPCYYSIPAAASLPHFLDADPSLLEDIEGLNPDQEKHGSFLVVQQKIGLPIGGHSKTQTNLVMGHTHYNAKITPFNNKVIPLFWCDMFIPSLPTHLVLLMKLSLQILPITQTILLYLLGIGGVATIMRSLSYVLKLFNQQRQKKQEMQRCLDSELKIPLVNGECTSIIILPTIKKVSSKTDLLV